MNSMDDIIALPLNRTDRTLPGMAKRIYGAEEARILLPELLERAHQGVGSLITKRGKPYAEVVPVGTVRGPRIALLSLAGTGRGLWGRSSRSTLKRLRDEWQ
jgi:antitoxin (DNA-binding transcriptional repressor) of toxin-antitoxin stability system